MSVKKLHETFKNLKYQEITNKANFSISKSDKIYLIKGTTNKSEDEVIKHLSTSKELLKIHSSITHIEDINTNLRYIRIKPKMKYVQTSCIDRLEQWEKIILDDCTFFKSELVKIPEALKEKYYKPEIFYINQGLILCRVSNEKNKCTKIEVYLNHPNLGALICDVLAMNMFMLLLEFINN
jgi:hypothetical protein